MPFEELQCPCFWGIRMGTLKFHAWSSSSNSSRLQLWSIHGANCLEKPCLSGWWFQSLWKIWKSVGMIIPNWMEKITSSTAQGGGGSFKNRKPIGEVGCCESGMAERSHWWTERCLRSPFFRSLSLTIYLPTYLLSMYLSIYRSIYLSLSFFHSITQSIYLSIYLSVCLSVCLSVYRSVCLSVCLSV